MTIQRMDLSPALLAGLLLLNACGDPIAPDERNSDLSRGQSLAATCSGCHSAGNMQTPTLEGFTKQALTESLLAYKADDAGSTVMHRIARGYSESDISQLAVYLADTNQ